MKALPQRLAAPVLALLVVLFAVPATASARPGWEEVERALHLSFRAPTSNGYAMSVETAGHRQVTLTLAKGSVTATYRTTGRVSREGIEAKFGALGEIAVEFDGRPTRFSLRPGLSFGLPRGLFHRECRGRRPQQEVGSFHGTIRFEGENGFTRIDTDRAKGKVRRTYRRFCKGGLLSRSFAATLGRASASAAKKPTLHDLYINTLVVRGEQGGRELSFAVLGFSGSSGVPLLDELVKALGPFAIVETSEHREGMLIKRRGLAFGEEGSLIVSPPKRKRVSVTIAFPKPLEGTAKFDHVPGSPPSWVGSLVARLPGAGAVPLTGEGLEPTFCRASIAEEESPSLKQAERGFEGGRDARLLLRQGSGSHSQALADVRLSWSR